MLDTPHIRWRSLEKGHTHIELLVVQFSGHAEIRQFNADIIGYEDIARSHVSETAREVQFDSHFLISQAAAFV